MCAFRGLDWKTFRPILIGARQRGGSITAYLSSRQGVYVCVFVAGTKLSHLCVIMTNQHVD